MKKLYTSTLFQTGLHILTFDGVSRLNGRRLAVTCIFPIQVYGNWNALEIKQIMFVVWKVFSNTPTNGCLDILKLFWCW